MNDLTVDIYHKYLKNIIKMRITEAEQSFFHKATKCSICEKDFNKNDKKVRDHDHINGKYMGAAHDECNLKFKEPGFIPIIFPNLSGYDAHLFIKQLGVYEGEINCIPNNEEKYISFTKKVVVATYKDKKGNTKNIYMGNRFIDSFKLMPSGLEGLVKNLTDSGTNDEFMKHTKNRFQEKTHLLLRKGVYPYDYMDSPDRMKETQLPKIHSFYSILNDSNISQQDYDHAQNVWKEFNVKTMQDYHDLYLTSDVLLLADVFENFRDVCSKNYKLDPAWYYTAPGLSWDAMMKETGVKLELLSDPDMLLMFKKEPEGESAQSPTDRQRRITNT